MHVRLLVLASNQLPHLGGWWEMCVVDSASAKVSTELKYQHQHTLSCRYGAVGRSLFFKVTLGCTWLPKLARHGGRLFEFWFCSQRKVFYVLLQHACCDTRHVVAGLVWTVWVADGPIKRTGMERLLPSWPFLLWRAGATSLWMLLRNNEQNYSWEQAHYQRGLLLEGKPNQRKTSTNSNLLLRVPILMNFGWKCVLRRQSKSFSSCTD